jgi:hypothetical protein
MSVPDRSCDLDAVVCCGMSAKRHHRRPAAALCWDAMLLHTGTLQLHPAGRQCTLCLHRSHAGAQAVPGSIAARQPGVSTHHLLGQVAVACGAMIPAQGMNPSRGVHQMTAPEATLNHQAADHTRCHVWAIEHPPARGGRAIASCARAASLQYTACAYGCFQGFRTRYDHSAAMLEQCT